MTMAAFLTWFGGTGYLLVHLRHIWVFAGLALASLAGLTAAAILFWFVAKVLMANDHSLDPLDYDMIGVLGHVSSTIRSGGTGEIIFEQVGVRKACAARSDSGDPLAKGEEVVVTRYEGGIAYVRRWDELAAAAGISPKQEISN
jgi:membrane protein implicated in regulation of membrane protease activity